MVASTSGSGSGSAGTGAAAISASGMTCVAATSGYVREELKSRDRFLRRGGSADQTGKVTGRCMYVTTN
jgi:hypothetical protein